MQVPNKEISDVLAWGDDNGATTEEVAVYFLKNYESIWTQWVPADVADKVRAAL
jgi:glycine betaine/proline transport system substrate-binding protein